MKKNNFNTIYLVIFVIVTFSLIIISPKLTLLITDKKDWDAYQDEWDPIHKAAYCGDISKINSLIDKGVKVDIIDKKSNMTPLEVAIRAQQYNVVKVLLENYADVNLMNNNKTPLMIACRNYDIEIVKLLLEYGADVNAYNTSGWTALKSSISDGTDEIFTLLIESGADINFRHEKIDDTALMFAVSQGDYEKVKILIEAGADKKIVTKNDKSAKTLNEIYNKEDKPDIYEAIAALLSD